MIKLKSGKLSQKDKKIIEEILDSVIDIYGDGYITKQNLRLYIKQNKDVLFNSLQKGDRIAFNENGLILLYGKADKSPRTYIKVLTKDEDTANKLLKVLSWNIKEDLYAKIKKTNPLKEILEKNGFHWVASRGKECLLCRKYINSSLGQNERIGK